MKLSDSLYSVAPGHKPRFLCVGTAGVGFVYSVSCIPQGGETLIAKAGTMMAGGKSGNHAVALSHLGSDVELFTILGTDPLADVVLNAAKIHGYKYPRILRRSDRPTMNGVVLVEPNGENRIILDAGCVGAMVPDDLDAADEAFDEADICIVGMDGFPDACAIEALRRAKAKGCLTIYNPAPPPQRHTLNDILVNTDTVIPNQQEAAMMTGLAGSDLKAMANRLHEFGAQGVVITCGAEGAFLSADGETEMVPVEGFTGVARDTNGAGDSFIAAFACAIGAGQSLRSAVRYACHAAALITQGPGLVEALHFWADLEPPVPQKS